MLLARATAVTAATMAKSAPPVPTPGVEQARGRGDVLRVAVDLFAVGGFAGTSMRDIAGAAKCSVANVYHHFRNKEALWLAVLAESIADLPATLLAAANGSPADTAAGPLDRVDRLIRAHVATSHRFTRELQILFIDEGRLSAESNAVNRKLQHAVLRLYMDELRALAGAGVVRDADLKITALNVLGVVNWHLRWMPRAATPARRKREADAIVAFVLRALDERSVAA